MTGSSSIRSCASLPSAGLSVSSARTSLGTRTDSLAPSSRHWKGWATALRQEYSARAALETATAESGFSSWPTATVSSQAQTAEAPTPGQTGGTTLPGAAIVATRNWASPTARNWPAPAARDWRSDASILTDEDLYGTKGKPLARMAMNWQTPLVADAGEKVTAASHQLALMNQAATFDPSLFRAPPIAGGSTSSTDTPNSNQPSVKRRLNPIFVEALMRWPIGWTDFGCSETGSIPLLPPTPGYVSTRGCDAEIDTDRTQGVPALRRAIHPTPAPADVKMAHGEVVQQGMRYRCEKPVRTQIVSSRDEEVKALSSGWRLHPLAKPRPAKESEQ